LSNCTCTCVSHSRIGEPNGDGYCYVCICTTRTCRLRYVLEEGYTNCRYRVYVGRTFSRSHLANPWTSIDVHPILVGLPVSIVTLLVVTMFTKQQPQNGSSTVQTNVG